MLCGIPAMCGYAAFMFYKERNSITLPNTADPIFAGGLKNVVFAYVLLYRVFDNDVCSSSTAVTPIVIGFSGEQEHSIGS